MLKTVVHRNWEELEPLAERWNQLLARSRSDTIFLTWEWCRAWWKAYGGGRSVFVLTAWQGQELVGVAPFYKDFVRRWYHRSMCLRIIGAGSGDSDYMDCFAEPGLENTILSGFVELLESCREDWDLLQIEGMREDSPFLSALREVSWQVEWPLSAYDVPCATLRLPRTWDEYLHTLRPRVRTKARACIEYLEQLKLMPAACRTETEVDVWLTELFDLHMRRWQQRNRPGVFRDASKRAFYHELSKSALKKGWLAFHRLAWGERPLSLQYGFRYQNRIYILQEGFEPSFDRLRPGFALRSWVLRHEIENGLSEYDFLAGTARHKLDWGAQQKMAKTVFLTWKQHSTGALESSWPLSHGLRASIGRFVPGPLLSLRRQALRAGQRRRWGKEDSISAPLTRRAVRWSVSKLYSSTPIGNLSRYVASLYANRRATQRSIGSGARSSPVCTILRYHRVNNARDPFFTALPVAEFEFQMQYLARHFTIVSLDQLASGQLPIGQSRGCVALTFDDGYRDNFVYAFPILKQLNIPATIFLTTEFIDSGKLLWYDQVRLAFKLTLAAHLSLESQGGPSASLDSESKKLKAMEATLAWLRCVDDNIRLRALPKLFDLLRVPDDLNLPSTMLSWDEIHHMSQHGITFGAHTVTHPVLGKLSRARIEEEVVGSKMRIEARLRSAVRHFAYPFGKRADFGRAAKQVVQASGFQTAVTTVSGCNGPGQDVFELKRLNIAESDPGIFGLKLDWYLASAPAGWAVPHESERRITSEYDVANT